MRNEINEICEFRKNYPAVRNGGIKSNDESLAPVKHALEQLRSEIENRFRLYKKIRLKVVVSAGAGYFPAVLHLSLLPPGQRVSDGVYTVICFDKLGRGLIAGCAESKTRPKGLQTVDIASVGSSLDIDGFRDTTEYSHCFANPREFRYPMSPADETILGDHLIESLEFNLTYLNLVGQTQSWIKSEVRKIRSDLNIPETEKKDLIKCRRGQGRFRRNALRRYHRCQVTGLTNRHLLVASHIKPWRIASNAERLDVDNCLLLATNYDRLFDLGYITFVNGRIQVSPKLRIDHLELLGINPHAVLSTTSDRMTKYLEYHTAYIFKS